jgi:NADH-quinone oxidoreductase subunit F
MQPTPHVTGHLTEHCAEDAYASLKGYERSGGYQVARRVLAEESPEDVIDVVRRSGLTGRGGAGFSAGQKWAFMPAEKAEPHYLVCNADESEPGSFKDRLLLERAPHLVIEGILIAAHAIRADTTFLYLRGEYAEAARVMGEAIEEARAKGVLGKQALGSGFAHDVVLVRGAGAYICGEETGLLESLEGKKGLPRPKPPYPAERGAFGAPTTVNNVETLCHVPHILGRGAEWFEGLGLEGAAGTTLFGVSGHVERPGLFELPLGTPLDEIVFEHAGGVAQGRKLKGVIPGGVSMPILPAGEIDVPMTDAALRARGSGLGTGAIVVIDESTCMVRVACAISEFFRAESCGQCTQCREGTSWIHKLVRRIEHGEAVAGDLAILQDVCGKMEGQTICSFADAAVWPIQSLLRHFGDEFAAHLDGALCPHPESFEL